MRKFATPLKIILSAAILLFLFRKANLSQSLHYLSEIRYPFIMLSILLIIMAQLVRAHRLAIMVFGGSARRKSLQVLRIQMVSLLPGLISPAKIGEATKIYMLQSELEVPVTRALACFVAERVLDLALLVPLAAFGLVLFFRSGLHFSLKPGGAFIAALAALAIVAAVLPVGFSWVRRRGISAKDLWRTVSPERLLEAGVATLLYWGLGFLEVWAFCKAALFDARPWHMTITVPPALLSSLIPVTFSGFGVREAVLVILLQAPPVAASYDQALLVSLMYVILGLGIPALMGVSFWLLGKGNGAPQH